MIVSNIIGGLGNQMFQYAIGRAVSLNTNLNYKIAIDGFNDYKLHNGFELDKLFNLKCSIATNDDLNNFFYLTHNYKFRKFLFKFNLDKLVKNKVIFEPYFHYYNAVDDINNPCYLHGYWQSEKYFIKYEKFIRNDFTFKKVLDHKNNQLLFDIKNNDSVSIHLRRSDYANTKNKRIFHECNYDYYKNALSIIKNYNKNVKVYIFSDDINFARNYIGNLSKNSVYVIGNDGDNSYKDMILMSSAKYNIIANSSFSWWSAWLNNNRDKVVVSPRYWFVNGNNSKDLIPEKWIRL